jgi:hypothetical protein
MIAVRFIIIGVYVIGLVYGLPILERRFSTPRKRSASLPLRPWLVVLHLWGPLFWIFPGVLWIDLLDISPLLVVTLSFLLPLCVLTIFLFVARAFKFAHSMTNRFFSYAAIVPGIFLLTGIALFMALAELGEPDMRFLMFVFSTVLPVLFSIALLRMWAPDVVPLADDLEKRAVQALTMILGYFTRVPKNVWVIDDGKIETRIAGNPGGAGPALLITEPHNVVVLKNGLRISRVVGPGSVLLAPMERPFKVVDLRLQMRSARVTAFTRDGVEVSVPISSMFRIKRGSGEVALGQPWPYNSQRDILQAVFTEEVDPSGQSALDGRGAHPWEDLPLKVAAHRVEQAIRFYTLDQLYSGMQDAQVVEKTDGPERQLLEVHRAVELAFRLPKAERLGDPLTRSTIGKLVRQCVIGMVERRGYEVLGGGVGNVVVPVSPAVIDHQVARWQSHFMISVLEWQASVERQRFAALGRLQQGARARLFNELIQRMSACLDSASDVTRDNFVAYYVLNSLLRIARAPEVRRMLPDTTLSTFEQLQQQFGERLGRPV